MSPSWDSETASSIEYPHPHPTGVEVVWNGDTAVREPVFHLEEDTYCAAISTADPTVGETYDVSAVAQGEDQFETEPELLGVSDGGRLTVTTTATMAIAATVTEAMSSKETRPSYRPTATRPTRTDRTNPSTPIRRPATKPRQVRPKTARRANR